MESMKRATFLALLLFALPTLAQEPPSFNDIEAADALQSISSLLANEEVNAEALNEARSRTNAIANAASVCAQENSTTRARLEERFEPLREIVAEEASAESLIQRQSISTSLDEAIARQSQCEGLLDDARSLTSRISLRQNELSQQFLSARVGTVFDLAMELPERLAQWPSLFRSQFELNTEYGISTTRLLWYLSFAGLFAAVAGVVFRQRFLIWYEAAGGDRVPAQVKYLLPKPLAEFAPLWLEGAALYAVLSFAITDASSSSMVIRAAFAIFAFGMSCVLINWATGALSPSAEVRGLIPDHVTPLRIRLRIVALAICLSFVVLGDHWLAARISQPYVTGRTTSLFVVSIGWLYLLTYLGQIPGIRGRYRSLRFAAISASGIAAIAVLMGYQNLAGYLVQGVTRTAIALFLLWVSLWSFYICFNYLLEQKSSTASQVRSTLGITGKGSGTGIGFMQLVADLLLWITTIVYLIYVWDNTGSTLGKLRLSVVEGWDFGGVSLVPGNIAGGILLFAVLVVIIGWIKRWMDRRWLQRIVIERGARDAILTLFGYIAFVLATLISLKAARVDLTGLAFVSAALALGLGFGLQGIANNFVSGLILLFERPIRAGDFVSVDDVEGFVRRIRIRATEIETLDNQNVLVPNSELVSGRVTNWVLRDTHGRLQIRVGVAYGSDAEKVRDILERLGREHPEVITDGRAPAPRALFMGFGDSSLDFELRVRVQRIERRFSVMSDINFEIDKAFREAGVSIPFPQRDLHVVSYPEQMAPPVEPTKPAKPVKRKRKKKAVKSPIHVDDVTRSHTAEMEFSRDRSEVWTAITDIEQIKRWLAVEGQFSPQIGGRFELKMRDGYSVSGRIDIFMPPRRMRIIVIPDVQEGPLPTGPITIELIIKESDKGTRLLVTVTGIPSSEDWEEYYRLSVDRWQTALAELKSNVLGK
jgi:potassium efflux system protein